MRILCNAMQKILTFFQHKNAVEVDIVPALGEIITACNVDQAKRSHGACM